MANTLVNFSPASMAALQKTLRARIDETPIASGGRPRRGQDASVAEYEGSWKLYERALEEDDEGYDPEEPKFKVAMEWGLIRIGRLQLRYPFEEGEPAVFPEYVDVDDWTVNQSVWLLLKHDPEEAPNCFMEDSEEIVEEPPDPENFGFEVEMKLYGATAVLQGTNTIYPVLIGIIDSEGTIRQHRREDIDVVGRIV